MAYVQLSTDTTTVIGLFGGAQPDNSAVTLIDDNDPRVLLFFLPATANALLQTKIAAGIVITSTGTPALGGTYALDATTTAQIGSVARDFASGMGLPGGGSSFTYPDLAGTPHTFTGPQIVALYQAQRNLVLTLNQQAAIMANGGTPSWPAQSAVII